jgi:hypothetical protein
MNFFDVIFFGVLMGSGIGTFAQASYASADNARRILGRSAARYAERSDEELAASLRSTYGSLDGIVLVVLTAFFFRGMILGASLVMHRFALSVWAGLIVAGGLGALMPFLRNKLIRLGLRRRLDARGWS